VRHAGGALDGIDPQDRIAHLESLQQGGTRVSMTDEDGQQLTVKMVPDSLSYSEVGTNGVDRTLIANVQFIVIATGSGASVAFAWDGGVGWDQSGVAWVA
jgi:hypothetical protein